MVTEASAPVDTTVEPMSNHRRGIAGVVAAASALSVGELAAGLLTALPSLVSGVATAVIDSVPPPVKDFAIAVFGTQDKLALGVGIIVVTLLLGYVSGRASADRNWLVPVVFSLFGIAGALAAARTPLAEPAPALVNGLLSALAGTGVFTFLVATPTQESPDASRRAFLGRAGALATLAVLVAAGGRGLAERARQMVAGRDEVVLPVASEIAPSVPPAAMVDTLPPVVTPNADFYRIDTAPFNVPQVDLANWNLTVRGLTRREATFTFDDILAMPMVERHITIACVSNRVGGDLIGNALWLGVPLREIIDRAAPTDAAEQVVARSVDGFTVGFPIEAVYDGREALLAVGMNGEPLPFEHGFPARLVVAGLYGYVSATKWLSEIELTTWDGFDAYWIPRGWAKEAPVKTQSRIDTPQSSARIPAGSTMVGGVAWAPTRGISMVEVQVDGGEWRQAELAEAINDDTWRQWTIDVDLAEGVREIAVRATDGTGETQTAEIVPPAPDGATGYHTIRVQAQ